MFEGFETRDVAGTDGVTIHLRIGGSGAPILLLHGYPQCHVMWHRMAPDLARDHTVVCADLRGYGDSSKPAGTANHDNYSKRAMAADMVAVMNELGFNRFVVIGHDRGGRVAHRMALDHPDAVTRLVVLDIVPTHTLFARTDKAFSIGYYHWFFLAQPAPLPERMIGADPAYFLTTKMGHWSAADAIFDAEAMAEYLRCFSDPATIHASCEDYRAAATIDLEHDEADLERKVMCPTLALWGKHGLMHKTYDVLETWREKCHTVNGKAVESGHFLPEEAPEETLHEVRAFLGAKG
ncbi:MAG: alpha/beta hydrolase [Rhodospirillales bacterium]|nr:alpha/beta hydrolase [Rhodospirillales bacterium]MBO6786935.1 alpha/beta hydrolase [Rhodospirillales bacterium]